MFGKYIIKNDEIYEVISENKAAKVKIKNGVASVSEKDTTDYDASKDFLYAFFEIRAKFAYLFDVEEVQEEEPKKAKVSISKSKSEE